MNAATLRDGCPACEDGYICRHGDGCIVDEAFGPTDSQKRRDAAAATRSFDRERREAIAAQGISTFLRELYKCGGSITFSYGGGITRGSKLPEGVTAQEMVERLQAVASAEVAQRSAACKWAGPHGPHHDCPGVARSWWRSARFYWREFKNMRRFRLTHDRPEHISARRWRFLEYRFAWALTKREWRFIRRWLLTDGEARARYEIAREEARRASA